MLYGEMAGVILIYEMPPIVNRQELGLALSNLKHSPKAASHQVQEATLSRPS
jgi:hypothetical protein